VRLAWITGLVGLAIVSGFTLYAVTMLPPLHRWHLERLTEEFSALRHSDLDFATYLEREDKLFAEYHDKVAGWNSRDEAYLFSRFNPASPVNLLVDGAPYNRSFRLIQTQPKGQALLIHGLTDSPYSMKALADSLLFRWLLAFRSRRANSCSQTTHEHPFRVAQSACPSSLSLALKYSSELLVFADWSAPSTMPWLSR